MSSISPIPRTSIFIRRVISRFIPFVFGGDSIVCSSIFRYSITRYSTIESICSIFGSTTILRSIWFTIMKPIAISSAVKPANKNYWLVTHVSFKSVSIRTTTSRTTYTAPNIANHSCIIKNTVGRGHSIQKFNILTISNLVCSYPISVADSSVTGGVVVIIGITNGYKVRKI